MDQDELLCRSGEDRISGLPDELLHIILARLRSARFAARTSVLSRRWRHVWAYMPELVLGDRSQDTPPPPSYLDTIDAALGACLAQALEHLTITISAARDRSPPPVLARRAAPWLRFASQRVVGGALSLLTVSTHDNGEEAAIELPACAGAKSIMLFLARTWRLGLPPAAGSFAALTSLTIRYGHMEGSELTALVCTRCPRLSTLNVSTVLVATHDITIRSNSLLSVELWIKNIRRLEIVAPRLEKLSLFNAIEASISTPKLHELVWQCGVYDPRCHQFVDVGRRLRLLQITRRESVVASLMRRFDEVDELKLEIDIQSGVAGYESFLNETNKLPKCKTLGMSFQSSCHALAPTMLHLLRSCNGIRTLFVELHDFCDSSGSRCPSSCPCCIKENYRIDDISLNSLEEVKISSYTSPHGELEFVKHLSRCNTPILKRLVIKNMMFYTPPPTKETCEKIHNMCRPNVEVEFYVLSAKGHVLWN